MPASSPAHADADRRYADWKAPAEDSQILIWPEPQQLFADVRLNQKLLSNSHREKIQNVPLAELRCEHREWIGHKNDDQPIIATGHQTELYHAGVWVKDVLIDAAAKRIGAEAYHVAVDTDAPKHLALRWPGESLPITDDPSMTSQAWSGLVDAPLPAYLDRLLASSREIQNKFAFEPMLPQFLLSLRRLALQDPPVNLSAAITNAMHELDWNLGLRHYALLLSPMLMGRAYLALVHHVMSRAAEFAKDYNAALAKFRRDHGTHSPSRPMPDLFAGGEDDAIEAPFWLDNLATGKRTRPSVFAIENGFVLELLSGEEFFFDPSLEAHEAADRLAKFLRQTQHRLSPRALMLTLFLRLLMADEFVHGIGGGRYDQVADTIIATHFGLEPPKFAVTTATLYFPPAVGRQRVCLPCVVQDGHRLKHAVLGDAKKDYVSRIESLPRCSRQRQIAFSEMHRARKEALKRDSRLKQWEQRLREAEARDLEDQQLFDRELFYAIQPRERLERTIEEYGDQFGSA
jgi:hypothetical protein